jgi:Lens epithelium-derived growth factor (LEDGF)
MKNNNDFELSADNITDNDNSADESQLQIAEDVPKSTPQPVKKKAVVSKPKYEVFTPEPEVAKENDEKVSRSGRKIKEKKMNMDEMDPDEMFTQPRKRFKIEEPKTQKSRDSAAIEEFRASKMHILMDPVKKNLLENQYEMLNVIQEIKMALGLGQADIERAVDLLESFHVKNLPNITDLMLLKYPNTVDSIKRLKKYVGNLNSWGMEDAQVEQFQQKSEKIRSMATVIYDQFKVRESFN